MPTSESSINKNPNKGKTTKFKSAVDLSKERSEWKQPLRRNINMKTGEVEFISILVNVVSGDTGKDQS
jgi:hypothetical protein